MIDAWQAIILALIQGLTEFLPISSSAHLILPSALLGWNDQGLAFDVAVHFGSLIAVLFYFRVQVKEIAVGGVLSLTGRWTEQGKMAWLLVLATIPAALAGLLFDDYIEQNLRNAQTIAIMTLVGAFLLALADRNSHKSSKKLKDITWILALALGVAQAMALIPGTSRSGITITFALILGFQRVSAAEFSFLMSIPIIMLSAGWKTLCLLSGNDNTALNSIAETVPWGQILICVLVSAVSAYLCIQLFLKFIERIGLMPFVIYRVLLGLGLICFIAF